MQGCLGTCEPCTLKLRCNAQVEPSSQREANGALRSIVGEALLALIQRPSAISAAECPETLVLDLQRLVAAQNELQRLSLIGASLLVAQMLLGAKGLPSSPLTAENCRQAPLRFDHVLVSGQNKLQRLSLVGASLLIAQMLLGAKGLPSLPITIEKRRQAPLAL